MERTKVTSKFQTTVPEGVRNVMNVRAGGEVQWHVIRAFAVVESPEKMKDPVSFLTGQTRLKADAVKLVHQAREELA